VTLMVMIAAVVVVVVVDGSIGHRYKDKKA